MKFRQRFSAFILLVVLCTTVIVPPAASAATYTSYTQVSLLPNDLTGAQGFAVNNGYAYSVKVNTGLDTQAVIYATNMSSGVTSLMTNGDNSTTIATYLSHANDMAAITIDGVTYLYIVTGRGDAVKLVKLKILGNAYFKVGEYDIFRPADSTSMSMSGIEITSQTGTTINFLFKTGIYFYRGSLGLNATSGTINVAAAPDFTINLGSYGSYQSQSVGYWSASDSIYVPYTSGNNSVVLVYHNVSTASGAINADPDLLFSITESASIEMESVSIAPDGKLWFNTNRHGGYDNVGYINGYSAPGVNTMFAGKSAASTGAQQVELGTKFQASAAGYLAGVKVYGVTGESGVHKVRIWRNADGALVGGPFDFTFTGSNRWETFYLPTPLKVTAGTEYTVAVSTGTDSSKKYAAISGDLTGGGSSGNLSWPANAGVYTTTMGTRPTSSFNGTNYLRDVIFYPETGTTEDMFGVITRTASGGNGGAYELGTVFTASVAGQIKGVRVYGVQGESGNHTIRIWRNSDNTVIGGPYTFNFKGNDSWVRYNLATPVSIAANISYTVSVTTGTDTNKLYAAIPGNFNSAGSNANHLFWTANAGVYTSTLGTRPTLTFNGTNYLRDIEFTP